MPGTRLRARITPSGRWAFGPRPVPGTGFTLRSTSSGRSPFRTSGVALDALEAQDSGETVCGALQFCVDVASGACFAGELADPQDALRPVGLDVGAAEEPVAGEQREDVVAIDPLVLALVDLDQMLEPEQPHQQGPVPDQVVERREKDRRGRRPIERRIG